MSKKEKAKNRALMEQKELIGENLSFAAAEAYKLLRTNLMFALPDEGRCRVVGVTSSVRGEGKSTVTINLAYTMAQAGMRVLLIEADMRLPAAAKRLDMKSSPGLSNLLAGLSSGMEVIQTTAVQKELYFIAAGDIPPNPSELLGSEQMKETVQALSSGFDIILLDLPPINAVSDPLVVSKLTDGMIMVVRENYSNRRSLNAAMRQLQFADAKILGFAMTGAGHTGSRYKSYHKKYGYEYGYGYYGKSKKDKTGAKAAK